MTLFLKLLPQNVMASQYCSILPVRPYRSSHSDYHVIERFSFDIRNDTDVICPSTVIYLKACAGWIQAENVLGNIDKRLGVHYGDMFVQLMRGERFRSDYGIIYVRLVITILPIFIVYFCLSKYIIAGVALGGVKE